MQNFAGIFSVTQMNVASCPEIMNNLCSCFLFKRDRKVIIWGWSYFAADEMILHNFGKCKKENLSLFMTANEKNVRKYWRERAFSGMLFFPYFISRLCRFLVQCLVKLLSTVSCHHTTSMAFQPYPSISCHRLRNSLSLCVLIVPFLFLWEKKMNKNPTSFCCEIMR